MKTNENTPTSTPWVQDQVFLCFGAQILWLEALRFRICLRGSDEWYFCDLEEGKEGTCDCAAFRFTPKNSRGVKEGCKHLRFIVRRVLEKQMDDKR